jgi:hypothetical protein
MPVADDTYVRPFGPNAPWNIPVADLPRAENSEELASKLWNDSYTDRAFRNFNINNTSYTYPVYEVTDETPFFPVVDRNGWGNLGGTRIPFDPSWKAAPGSDAQIVILDPATGREWNLWQAEFDGDSVNISNGNLVPGSYFDKEDGFAPSRGVGIQYSAMLVRPEEVAQGVIEHALSMPIRNTSGSEFVAPGTKLEFPGVRPDGIPEGTRFALDVSYEQIDAHLARLPTSVPDVTKASLRTLMVAMKDYGWFITDTSGSTHFQLESTTSAQKEWEALGMIDKDHGGGVYPRDALDGLITQSRIVAFVPSDEYPAQLDEEDSTDEDDLLPMPPDEDDTPAAMPPGDAPGPVTEGEPPNEEDLPPSNAAEPPPPAEGNPVPPDEAAGPDPAVPDDQPEPTPEEEQPDEEDLPPTGAADPPPEYKGSPIPPDPDDVPDTAPPAGQPDPSPAEEQPNVQDPVPSARDHVPDAPPPKGAVEQPDEAHTWRGGKSFDGPRGVFERIFDVFRRLFGRDDSEDDAPPGELAMKSDYSRPLVDDEDDLADLSSILPVVGRMEDQDISRYMEDDDACQEDYLV